MMVPILKQGHVLIATIMAALSDEDMRQFREALLDRVVTSRASAVIIEITQKASDKSCLSPRLA